MRSTRSARLWGALLAGGGIVVLSLVAGVPEGAVIGVLIAAAGITLAVGGPRDHGEPGIRVATTDRRRRWTAVLVSAGALCALAVVPAGGAPGRTPAGPSAAAAGGRWWPPGVPGPWNPSWTWPWTTTTRPTTTPTSTAPPTTTTTPRPTSTTPPTTTTAPTSTGTTPPPTGLPTDAQTFWLHLNSTPTSDAMLAAEAKRHRYIVLNAWEGGLIPKLKAANPAVQVFVYKDLSSTRSYACRDGRDDAELPTGVGYCFADSRHPEWFLTDSSGRRFTYSGYGGHWQMDVGDVDYQNTWASNVISSSKASGFDGVLMDNALFACDTYHSGVCPAKYPTNASFQNAYLSMLAGTRARFREAGLKTVANMSNARLHNGVWNAYMNHLDGGFDEWWLAFGDNDLLPEYPEGWSRQVAEIAANEANGKITWVQGHFTPGNERAFRYALASYFMAAGARSAISEIGTTDAYGDPTTKHAAYDWVMGTPSGPYRSVAPNVFRRDFGCGVVVVNANPSGSPGVTVQLGTTLLDEARTQVSAVTLPGTSGTILRKAC
ncbi:putative glycoside hydrolase [Saccharothrix sp. NPDC042600]|uniref:putative glycoside hydrolase n=1 Tax=Saccharothrix TaxID=2071 RepID=UPI0033ED22B0|nr:hypothetical protein GCM10017745_49530 [Saccharothrix mutabilis subsp. capreolus]